MNLAFIPSAYRTPFFLAVARRLENQGHRHLWLSPNRRWARWLKGEGVSPEDVFDLTRWGNEYHRRTADAEDRRELQDLEERGGLKLHELIQMDPLLSRRHTGRALRYLAVARRRLDRFLAERSVAAVFGEQTWAFELLTGQVCRSRGIPHWVPHTIRFPDPRFGFFDGYREERVVALGDIEPRHRDEARDALQRFRERRPQPEYMKVDRAVVRPDAERLKLLARHLLDLAADPYDETSRRPLGLIANHSWQWLRQKQLSLGRAFERPDPDEAPPFVLFPLHRQPEASIDIKGSPYTHQIEVVRAMSRTLPLTHELWVKEHPVALPTRPTGFHRQLARIPGVRIIHHGEPIFPLLRSAALTVTITGTAAYEAALLERPAATIAPIFFERIVGHPRFDPFRDSLAEILSGAAPPRREMEVEPFLARLLARSRPGVVGDALWQPGSMDGDNLDRVAAGFLDLLEAYRDRLTDRPAAVDDHPVGTADEA